MMKFRSMFVLSVLCGANLSALAQEPGSVEEGQAKSATCVACHGATGNSPNPEWPNIAGQHSQYIFKQLQAFKAGERQNPLMSPIAAQLSEDDMRDLAAYYEKQARTGLEADPQRVALGQRLYRGGDLSTGVPACVGCHGPRGQGNPTALYPSISGQHATYVAAQLRNYRSGARQTDQNQMMRAVAKLLTDEQIDAVASYVQGMR